MIEYFYSLEFSVAGVHKCWHGLLQLVAQENNE
jgi:hypothetical protein